MEKLLVVIEGERKTLYDKNRFKEFMFTKLGVQRIFKGMFLSKGED